MAAPGHSSYFALSDRIVNADGDAANSFELHVATLQMTHDINPGRDIMLVG
jgi:hypothetical protein